MKLNLKYGLLALAGLGFSANVAAVDYGCSDITFTPEAYEAYEFVDQACQEIVERPQGIFAKLTAEAVRQTTTGGTRIRFRHTDGEWGPSVLVQGGDFLTGEEGERIDLTNVQIRTDFRVYVPMAFWTPPPPPAPEPMAEPVAAAAPPPPPPAPEPEPEPEPEMLPTTASNLPWLALFGALFLVLGGALRFSRR
jgi:hypothetical protein